MCIYGSLDKQSRILNVENKGLQKSEFSITIEYSVAFFHCADII